MRFASKIYNRIQWATIRSQRYDICVVRSHRINPIPLLMIRYYCSHFRDVRSRLSSNQHRVYWLLIDYKWRFDWLSRSCILLVLMVTQTFRKIDRHTLPYVAYVSACFRKLLYSVTATFPFAFTAKNTERLCHLFNLYYILISCREEFKKCNNIEDSIR